MVPSLVKEDLLQVALDMKEALSNPRIFERSATSIGRIRVSPLTLSMHEFRQIKKRFCLMLGHGSTADCSCKQLLKAAEVIQSLGSGGRLRLTDLWKQSGGAPSITAAQKIMDRLVYVPLAFVLESSSSSSSAAWVATEKIPGLNYTKVDGLLAVLHPQSLLPTQPVISKQRLRAVMELASTPEDKKLIEFAVLGDSSRAARAVIHGTNDVASRSQLKVMNENVENAMAIFDAYSVLADLDTVAEIKSQSGISIDEKDVSAACAALSAHSDTDEEGSGSDEELGESSMGKAPLDEPGFLSELFEPEDNEIDDVGYSESDNEIEGMAQEATAYLCERARGDEPEQGLDEVAATTFMINFELNGEDKAKMSEFGDAENWVDIGDDHDEFDFLEDSSSLAEVHELVLNANDTSPSDQGEKTAGEVLSSFDAKTLVTKLRARNKRRRKRLAKAKVADRTYFSRKTSPRTQTILVVSLVIIFLLR